MCWYSECLTLRLPISLEILVSEILKFNFKICFFVCVHPSSPDRTCNPSLISIFQQITSSTVAPLEIENQTAIIIVDIEETVPSAPYLQWWDAQSIVGLAIFVLCILYSRYSVFTVIYGVIVWHSCNFFFQIIQNFQVFSLWPLTVRLATAPWASNFMITLCMVETAASRSLEMCLYPWDYACLAMILCLFRLFLLRLKQWHKTLLFPIQTGWMWFLYCRLLPVWKDLLQIKSIVTTSRKWQYCLGSFIHSATHQRQTCGMPENSFLE